MSKTKTHCISLLKAALMLGLIVFTSNPGLAADPGKNGPIAFVANLTGTNQIYTITPDGTGLFQVTSLPPPIDPSFALAPDFSPDGTKLVFPHDMTGALELYVINADGSGLTQITHDGRFH